MKWGRGLNKGRALAGRRGLSELPPHHHGRQRRPTPAAHIRLPPAAPPRAPTRACALPLCRSGCRRCHLHHRSRRRPPSGRAAWIPHPPRPPHPHPRFPASRPAALLPTEPPPRSCTPEGPLLRKPEWMRPPGSADSADCARSAAAARAALARPPRLAGVPAVVGVAVSGGWCQMRSGLMGKGQRRGPCVCTVTLMESSNEKKRGLGGGGTRGAARRAPHYRRAASPRNGWERSISISACTGGEKAWPTQRGGLCSALHGSAYGPL